MMWNGDGSWSWWGPGLIFMIFMMFCMVLMARMMMSHSHGSRSSHAPESYEHRPDGAERILAERLAHGEIDIEEYERRLAALQEASKVDRT